MRDILPKVLKKLFAIDYKNLTDKELMELINNIDNELKRELKLKQSK